MSASNNNLDLTLVDSADLSALTSKINDFYMQDTAVKQQLTWTWERNQLMLDGKQWIVYDPDAANGGMWKTARVSDSNKYIPRPVTNYLFDVYQTLKSYVIKNKPRSAVTPNTQEYKDKVAAKIATLILETNWVRLKEQYNYETAAASLVTYGTVFKKSYWDTSSLSLVKVPRMVPSPITDPASGQVVGVTQIPATDPQTGDELFDELPLGDVNTYVIEPFRLALDPLAVNFHEARWIMECSIQPLEWIRETYAKSGEGYTGKAEEVKEEKELNGSLRRWYQLRTSSGTKDGRFSSSQGSTSSDINVENCAVVKEYYERPTAKYPKGRLIVVAGDIVVFSGPSPYEGPEQGDWHPYSECRWEMTPGRFWGKSPLDDVIEIQKTINSIDSVITLTRKTSAIPQKLIPTGLGISPGQWTGRPGEQVFFRPDGTGAMPQTVPGVGVDPSVFSERAQRVSDLKDISGAIDILRGDRPPGVNAASALSLLYEVGTGKLFPILDRWKMFVESDQKKQLRLIAKFYKEPRPAFVKMLASHNSDLAPSDINQFIGSDLYDNCNVIVEAGSNIPKLQAAKQSMLMELAQMGMLNLQDPTNRAKFQEDLGIKGYNGDVEPDVKRAEWENDLIDNLMHSPDNKPVVLAVDNHQLHITTHENRMKSPTFMSLPFQIQQAYMEHVQQHEQMQAQAMQAQMLQNQAMAPHGSPSAPPPAAAGGGHGPKTGGHSMSGTTSQIKNATMGADILTPATLGAGSRS
jgi:hypothetical protein